MTTSAPWSRRDVLRTSAQAVLGTVLASAPSQPAVAASPLPSRRNIDSLLPAELEAYKHAVQIVIDRSRTNPAAKDGYVWQAALHNDFERVRPDGSIGACEHRNELFFPWHRAHLAGFERILRETDPPRTANVTIPYWDWTKAASGRRFPRAFEDRASPLYHSGRYHEVTDVTPAILRAPDEIKRYVGDKDWLLFAGEPKDENGHGGSFGWVEQSPHNDVHPAIGPTMGDTEKAARDPIYWSFHAYIDLIWARWQRVHTSSTTPQPFSQPSKIIWVEPFTPVVSQTSQTHQLPAGYAYEYEYDFSIDASPSPAIDSNSFTIEMLPGAGLTRQSEAFQLRSPRRKLLRLREVVVLPDISYSVRVLVYPENVDPVALSEAQREQYVADSATVWMSGGHGHARPSLIFDITDAVARLRGARMKINIETRAVPIPERASLFSSTAVQLNDRLRASGRLFSAAELEER